MRWSPAARNRPVQHTVEVKHALPGLHHGGRLQIKAVQPVHTLYLPVLEAARVVPVG